MYDILLDYTRHMISLKDLTHVMFFKNVYAIKGPVANFVENRFLIGQSLIIVIYVDPIFTKVVSQ